MEIGVGSQVKGFIEHRGGWSCTKIFSPVPNTQLRMVVSKILVFIFSPCQTRKQSTFFLLSKVALIYIFTTHGLEKFVIKFTAMCSKWTQDHSMVTRIDTEVWPELYIQ